MKNTCLFLLFLFCGLAVKIDAFAPTPSFAKNIASSTFGDLTEQSAPFSFNTVAGQQAASSSSSSTVLFGKKAARAAGNDRKGKKERVKKQKDDVIEVEAVVLESLPNAMFRCAIEGAPDTQEPVLATISGRIRKNYVKILVGDKVQIELSPYDLTRGRITFRFR